jgi:hypothetical protein
MTLRDTELIGKKLVKYRFYRDDKDHQLYQYWGINGAGGIYVEFKIYGGIWAAIITHKIDARTEVKLDGRQAVFTPEWLVEEHKKLQAMFKFLRT